MPTNVFYNCKKLTILLIIWLIWCILQSHDGKATRHLTTVHLQRGITKNHIPAKSQKENAMKTLENIVFALHFLNNALRRNQDCEDGCLCLIGNENYTDIMKTIKTELSEEDFACFMRKLRESKHHNNHWEEDWHEGVKGRNCYSNKEFADILKEFY